MVLVHFIQFHKIAAPSPHTNDQIGVFLRVQLGILQLLTINRIQLQLMTAQFDIFFHQLFHFAYAHIIAKYSIMQITQVVADNLGKNITMAEAAQLLGFEYHYFSRLFHSLFSMNFRQFVNLYRIENACALLRSSSKDISIIAMECGFQTLRSFNRAFRELTGQTPSAYRNN